MMWRAAYRAIHRSATATLPHSAPFEWPLQRPNLGFVSAWRSGTGINAVLTNSGSPGDDLHKPWTRGIRSRAKPKQRFNPKFRRGEKRPAQRDRKALVGVPRGRSGWGLEDDAPDEEYELDRHGDPIIERIPVPQGIPTDHMAFYNIADSGRGLGHVPGVDSLFAVHGPSEVWAPHPDGLVRGHGAGGGIFAVFQATGAHFKVMERDVFYTSLFEGEVNSQVVFDNVLILGAVDWSWLGRPCIKDASVVTTIEEQTRSAKIYVTKFKRKTGYKRRQGHRQNITRFRVNEVRYTLPDQSRFSEHVPEYDPREKEHNFKFEL